MATYTKETALFDTGRIASEFEALGTELDNKQDAGEYVTDEMLNALTDSVTDRFGTVESDIDTITNNLGNFISQDELEAVQSYINTYLGENGMVQIDGQALVIQQSNYSVVITPSGVFFNQGDNPVAFLTSNMLNITNAEITSGRLILGNFAFVPRNGRLTLMKVKEVTNG